MAKDDYFVIVYKILAYLYVKLKAGEDIEGHMISHDSNILKINQRYWEYVIKNLIREGLITCETTDAWGKKIYLLDTTEITPKGIRYVCDNTLFEKVKEFLKEVKEITPFI